MKMEENSVNYMDKCSRLTEIYTLVAERFSSPALLRAIDAIRIVEYYSIGDEQTLSPLYDAIKDGSALEIKQWCDYTVAEYEFVGGHGT